MISSIYFIKIINVVPDPSVFFWMAVYVADAAAINLNSIKTLLVNDLFIIFIKGTPALSNGQWILSRNSPNYTVLDSLVFEIFLVAD